MLTLAARWHDATFCVLHRKRHSHTVQKLVLARKAWRAGTASASAYCDQGNRPFGHSACVPRQTRTPCPQYSFLRQPSFALRQVLYPAPHRAAVTTSEETAYATSALIPTWIPTLPTIAVIFHYQDISTRLQDVETIFGVHFLL